MYEFPFGGYRSGGLQSNLSEMEACTMLDYIVTGPEVTFLTYCCTAGIIRGGLIFAVFAVVRHL